MLRSQSATSCEGRTYGQRTKQNAVDERKDGRRAADAKRKGQHDGDGEARIATEETDGVLEISADVIENAQA